MDQNNEQLLEEISITHAHTPSDIVGNEIDFLSFYQSSFIKVEIRNRFFYSIQMFQMFFITVISTLVVLPTVESENSSIKIFNDILSFFYISPYFFNHSVSSYVVIGTILLLILVVIGYTFFIGFKIREDTPLNSNSLKPWIIVHRLFLPFPGYMIGCYLGFYFQELTQNIYLCQILLVTFTGMFWCWVIFTSNLLYNDYPFKRKNDVCQIHHTQITFDSIITIIPMIQTTLPSVLSVFVQPTANATLYSFLSSLSSIVILIYISISKPYINDLMNQYVFFLFLIKIPLSFVWLIEIAYEKKFELYLLFCIIVIIASFVVTRLLISCFFNCHKPAQTTVPSNFSNQVQDQVQTQINDSEISNRYQDQIDGNNQQIQNSAFDPTANCCYPFNLVSLTYQDLALGVYLVSAILLMLTLNAVAAQRMPIANALPDLIQDHFNISHYLRLNVAEKSFQFSNIIVLIQVFLLISYFLFVPQYVNARRLAFIYASLCVIRTVSFIVTSLPAPCSGFPKCPCSDPDVIKFIKKQNPVKVGLTWLFGLGMFLVMPQCGDLIISGHTMWLWLTSRTCCSVIKYVVPRPFNWLASCFLFTLTIITMIYIILARNHYSIDVWFGFVFTELLWTLYNSYWARSIASPLPSDSLLLRFIRWIETRPPNRVLMQTRRMALHGNA